MSRRKSRHGSKILVRLRQAVWPEAISLPPRLRWRAAFAAGLAAFLVHGASRWLAMSSPLLVAGVGASAVVLFALPSSPLAKPWALVGGYMVCALSGVTAAKLVADPAVAAALAVSLALAGMFCLRCLHPPGGAIALFAVIGGDGVRALGYGYVLAPVLLNALLLLAVAVVVDRLWRERRPAAAAEHDVHPAEMPPLQRIGLSHADVQEALAEYGRALYISGEDIDGVIELAEQRAWQRRHGELRCAEIMSRDVHTVAARATLLDVWARLRRRRPATLLVVDELRRVVGQISLADFVERARARDPAGLRRRLLALMTLRMGHGDVHADSIMAAAPPLLRAEEPIASLVPLLAGGPSQVAVIDEQHRLVGVITQSDLIAALFKSASGPAGDAATM